MIIIHICSYLRFSESSLNFLLSIWCVLVYFHDCSKHIVKNSVFTLYMCKDIDIIDI